MSRPTGPPAETETAVRPWRIGVTGHRALPADDRLTEQVRLAIRRAVALAPVAGGRPCPVIVLSPLAEGADRLVAREAMDVAGATLEAFLPLPAEDYCTDFATEASRQEFRTLLARAANVTIAAKQGSRNAAYEAAGQAVIDRADILIALWNGEGAQGRGGTAEMVAYARRQGVPLLWVRTEPPYPILAERDAAAARLAPESLG